MRVLRTPILMASPILIVLASSGCPSPAPPPNLPPPAYEPPRALEIPKPASDVEAWPAAEEPPPPPVPAAPEPLDAGDGSDASGDAAPPPAP